MSISGYVYLFFGYAYIIDNNNIIDNIMCV